ncbi:MAG TPA: hypothetical protein VII60_01925 [Acidimicrobiales bacterium]
MFTAVGLLAAGVSVGFILLFAPGLSDTLRSAGGQMLVVSLPALALTTGLLGATWARTQRIDDMVAWYLTHTVGDKLDNYLVGSPNLQKTPSQFPPLFIRMERIWQKQFGSFCTYRLFDTQGRRFDMFVKSNVFNFEISYCLHVSTTMTTAAPAATSHSYAILSLADWPSYSTHPLVELVTGTLYGSLSEGYSVYFDVKSEAGGQCVNYKLRQKLESNFLVSPYQRRYFAEDAAIASYFFYAEALAKGKGDILGGEL